jgi:hypothetical protein
VRKTARRVCGRLIDASPRSFLELQFVVVLQFVAPALRGSLLARAFDSKGNRDDNNAPTRRAC